MSDVNKTIQKWHASFKKGTDFDSWGQLVEAIDEYQILARQLQKEVQSTNSSDFTEEQKKTLGRIATCLEMRSGSLQCTQSKEEFKLEDLKKLETIIKNILTYNKEFPFDVQPVPLRKILAPGEEENLELEEEEDAAAGAGSTEAFPPRAPASQVDHEARNCTFLNFRYKKPTDFKRKKLQLLTKKPLYLHLHQTLHKDS
ncbi:axin interactor, dorsalization-associated protein [Seriola lalandi dorsalis]|uniref:axin interactor, dorsalization-associated protein n=1 Tax=Seriola lalandi dorsalis TaxID=1841481 RepID=UPI000C6F943B|nr:axin interactor, dorsalization-associated protein [Seriola lalandi dorsalis]